MPWLYTDTYRCLEILAKSQKEDLEQLIKLKTVNGNKIQNKQAGTGYYKLLRFKVDPKTEYELFLESCDVSLIYLSGSEDMFEQGIRYLHLSGDGTSLEESRRNTGIYRERYHFTPYKNWINDPNGLCWFKGYYHLYYQYNPLAQHWGDMYWGHAVSRDMVHWKDLPISLQPQEEVLKAKDKKGGAFSGCAVPVGDEKILFYYTRHYGDHGKDREADETQVMAESQDSISFGTEQIILEKENASFSNHFRDPKVEKWNDGKWYMVVGSCINKTPAVLYYKTDNMKHWDYEGILLEETGIKGIETLECPDAFWIGKTMVVLVGLMRYGDAPVEVQQEWYYTGTLEDGRLKTENTGILDFGGNLYAAQTFLKDDRRIMIGWISDFWQEHVQEENGPCGSMTFPRVVGMRDGKLILQPVEEIYSLRDKVIYHGKRESVHLPKIPENSWYAVLRFDEAVEFDMCLMEGENGGLYLTYHQGTLRLATVNGRVKRPDGIVLIEKIYKLELFVDRRVAEIFVNDGEKTGTRIFYGNNEMGCFSAEIRNPESVASAEVYTMNAIWTQKREQERSEL